MHQKVRKELIRNEVAYRLHCHADFPEPISSPLDFAAALGYPPERITKSVFLQSRDGEKQAIALCSVTQKLNLPAIAETLQSGRLTLATPEQLAQHTGYPSRGVSPIGVEPVPVLVDEALLGLPSILIGAGEVGVEVEINPADLVRIINAQTLPLSL